MEGRVPETHSDQAHVNPIVRFAVERRVTMAMAVIGILVMGWLSLERLPLEFLPSFSASFITVSAPYPSSSPEEVERLIVRPLEDALGTVTGVESLSATATASSGSVRLAFPDGTDMDLAAVEARDRVDRVRGLLPDDLERVQIWRFQTTDRPVFRFNLAAPWDRDRLYRFTEDVVVRRLQRIDGVADVSVRGLLGREVHVDLDPARLAALDVDVRDVAAALRANHLDASVGVIREGSRALLARVEGKLTGLDDIRTLPLSDRVRLGDVATVSFGFPDQEEFEFLNGQEALNVYVYKTSTANLLAMIDRVRAELDTIGALPDAAGLQLKVYRDDSEDVREGIAELRDTGLLGGTLAMVFMFAFLRRVRTTLLVGLSIPVSLVFTFVIMYLSRVAGWTDLTLNILSLMGLMLSVGMLVDSSIVVIESVFRHRQELGEDARTATLVGASEVALPIAASTLTTVCVFLPMAFLGGGGRFARFMGSLGLTVVVVMIASLVVALTVVPMVAARILSREGERAATGFDRISGVYERGLRFALRHRVAFSVVIVALLAASWWLYQGVERSFSFPSFERQVFVQVDTPQSMDLDTKRALYDEIYQTLSNHRDELEIIDIAHSYRASSGRSRGWGGGNRFDLYLTEEKVARRDTDDIRSAVEQLLPVRAGVTYTLSRSRRGMSGSASGIELRLEGERMEMLEVLAARGRDALATVPGVTAVDSSLESGAEEVWVRPDAERMLQSDLTTQAVGRSVASALSSRASAYLEAEEQELPVVVRHAESGRRSVDQLENLPLSGRGTGLMVGAVADVERRPGARAIERTDRRAQVTLTADTTGGASAFMAQRMAQQAVENLGLPAGYSVVQGEDWRSGAEDATAAAFVLGFALLLVYLVMASLFESFAQPFTIMFSVPFAFIGVGLVMRVASQPRSSTTDIGLVLLAGLVVNNAIVLVDHINRLRRQGLERSEAVVLGGRHRLRPIVMTAMTTILGLSPMVAPFLLPQIFGAPEGRAAFWSPVGLVLLGGLTTSTILTVTVIPVVYTLVDDATSFVRRVAAEVTARSERPRPGIGSTDAVSVHTELS
jgi:HAE1 family hydrophobic/amphiphilic exporter-1